MLKFLKFRYLKHSTAIIPKRKDYFSDLRDWLYIIDHKVANNSIFC